MLITHLLKGGRLRVFPGEGHLITMDEKSASHTAIKQFLTAESAQRSAAWKHGSTVSAGELRAAFGQVGFQLPPWSLINAAARKRHLALNGHAS